MNESMFARIERLELENRRMKRGCVAALLVVGIGTLAGAANQPNHEIVLRDPNNNNLRIRLGTNPNTGSAGLEIYDRQGRRRIVLATDANNDLPALIYTDANGNSKRQDRD